MQTPFMSVIRSVKNWQDNKNLNLNVVQPSDNAHSELRKQNLSSLITGLFDTHMWTAEYKRLNRWKFMIIDAHARSLTLPGLHGPLVRYFCFVAVSS